MRCCCWGQPSSICAKPLQQRSGWSSRPSLLTIAPFQLVGPFGYHGHVGLPPRLKSFDLHAAGLANAPPFSDKRPFAKQRRLNVQFVESRHVVAIGDAGKRLLTIYPLQVA
jgi:hypothetical protein